MDGASKGDGAKDGMGWSKGASGIGSRIERDRVKKQEGWVEGASRMNWRSKARQGRRVGGTRDWGKQVEWGKKQEGWFQGVRGMG